MEELELLAPARNKDIGIAAIDCGADAVYIAGPAFGARQAAGNGIEDIGELCSYAHRFGARIFVALNTILFDNELEDAYAQMTAVRDAGADAIIIQDMSILGMDPGIPLHASTQCAIRTADQARFLENLGFSRLILERELSLERIREIRSAVDCELEFFVHGALCVCYSGQCYMSEHICGKSANRGACIQACRNRYDLADKGGKILVKDRPLLSLKDFNLKERLEDLAEAGIRSFKIEGRLKNISYVKNIVRDYSAALDRLVSKYPDRYRRSSFGKVSGGFSPDAGKTFNRGFTELFLDGKRGQWATVDAAKSIGEEIGTVVSLNRSKDRFSIRPLQEGLRLSNGDGFSFISRKGEVVGFRGDVCERYSVKCKPAPELYENARLYRNFNARFEKEMESMACKRMIGISIGLSCTYSETNGFMLDVTASSEDGRIVRKTYNAGHEKANNRKRMNDVMAEQLSKTCGIYSFRFDGFGDMPENMELPLVSASFLNGIRREIASDMDALPCKSIPLKNNSLPKGQEKACKEMSGKRLDYKYNISNRMARSLYERAGAEAIDPAFELSHREEAELMRTKYCIRYELGLCPKYHGSKSSEDLFLLNNGRRFTLRFDCRNCEMTVNIQ